MIKLTKSSIKCWQRNSFNGKVDVGPNYAPVPEVINAIQSAQCELRSNNMITAQVVNEQSPQSIHMSAIFADLQDLLTCLRAKAVTVNHNSRLSRQ